MRHLELRDLDWRAKTITIVQANTGRPLRLPLLEDVGWAIIDYIRQADPTRTVRKLVKLAHARECVNLTWPQWDGAFPCAPPCPTTKPSSAH